MTVFAAARPPTVSPRAAITLLVGMAGLSFSLTILWLSMRAVLGIGGACAKGGPYVPAVECPDLVVALTPLSVFGLFIFGAVAWWGGARVGGGWANLLFLGWPALFLSLGWNFLEFGLWPPGGDPGELVWSWLICGVVFALMGGVPLVVGVWGAREASSGSRAYAGGRVVIHPRPPNALSSAPQPAVSGNPRYQGDPGVAERLERLARLHRAGELTKAEFEAAKRATLDEART